MVLILIYVVFVAKKWLQIRWIFEVRPDILYFTTAISQSEFLLKQKHIFIYSFILA